MADIPEAKIEIQRFLRDCGTCGAAKGYLHLPGQDRSVRVACRCEAAECPRCGRSLFITPSPMLANDTGGGSWESGLLRARCATCGPLYT